jgi:hypothetical protein
MKENNMKTLVKRFDENPFLIIYSMLCATVVCAAEQRSIPCVERMPNIPQSYEMRDWKSVALAFDALVFNSEAKGECFPLVHLYTKEGITNFALSSYVGPTEPRENSNEGIAAMGAVLGASLVGIDKRKGTIDWVRSCQQFYNPKQQLILNRVGGGAGHSYWYDVFPHIQFASLAYLYPDAAADTLMAASASRWRDACFAMKPIQGEIDFEHQAFNFWTMKPSTGKWREPDAAAGIGWIQYMAWMKSQDTKFLRAAMFCVDALNTRTNNPYYEVQLPFGAYTAVRMNAEQGTTYDVDKIINWCFDHNSVARPDMGMITDSWQDMEMYGLYGSVNRQPWRPKGGGYAFAMNTYALMWATVPIARYDTRYARAIGKWMVNAASASRYFYADATPTNRQSCAWWKGDPEAVIAYEGLRYKWHKDEGDNVIVGGDVLRGKWAFKTDFGIYGSALVGVLGSIVKKTDVEGILQLDCLATDFYRTPAYPTYLYYNPFSESKTVTLNVGKTASALYDATSQQFIAKQVTGVTRLTLKPDTAMVVVLCPTDGTITSAKNRLLCNTRVIDWATK